jgi:hypothetical protein
MNRWISMYFVVGVICFALGFLFGIVAITAHRTRYVEPEERRRESEAYAFFYKTMNELSKGTYNPESGFVRQDVLNEYKKYAEGFGSMCQVHLGKDSAGNFVGKAFFPSGDIFDVEVFRNHEGMMLSFLLHRDWEPVWKDALDRYRISDTNQRQVIPAN